MTTTQILKKARDLLSDPERWIQGFGDKNRYCIAHAIFEFGTPIESVGAALFFRETLKIKNIAAWNDTPGRTHAEVLMALDTVIKASEMAAA
jgi:hypothetical protein